VERLWSPWRSKYVSHAGESDDCFLCTHASSEDDAEHHVLYRASRTFIVLNAYPYNSGHLMVAPLRHVGDIHELERGELHELMDETRHAVRVVEQGLEPHGFNVGMNLGRVAGAGLPGHLHVHIVPRWGGDTNFMPVVGETKVMPELLAETYEKLHPLFE
jgi:ATP adenylyltransferase